MELVGPAAAQCKTSNSTYSATVTVTNFPIAPKNPEHTFTHIQSPRNSRASIFWRSLDFSVPRYGAKKADFFEKSILLPLSLFKIGPFLLVQSFLVDIGLPNSFLLLRLEVAPFVLCSPPSSPF